MLGYNVLVVSNEALLWFLLICPIVCFVGGYLQALALHPDQDDFLSIELPPMVYPKQPPVLSDLLDAESIVFTTPYMIPCEDDITWVKGVHA